MRSTHIAVYVSGKSSQIKSEKQRTYKGVIYSYQGSRNNNHQIPTDLYQSLSIRIVVVNGQNSLVYYDVLSIYLSIFQLLCNGTRLYNKGCQANKIK